MADEVIDKWAPEDGSSDGGATPVVTPVTEPTAQTPTNSVVARRKKRSVEEALDRIATKLESMSSGSGGGSDSGEKSWNTVFDGQVTTEYQDFDGGINIGQIGLIQGVATDTVKVTFDGTEYECQKITTNDFIAYGGLNSDTGMPDFSVYPFLIAPEGDNLLTEQAGTYTLKIEAPSDEFSVAIVEIVNNLSASDKVALGAIDFCTIVRESDGDYINFAQVTLGETLEVPLVNGLAIARCEVDPIPATIEVTTVGDITLNSDGPYFEIRGDGTITLDSK